jgi:hypothetical protein
MKIDKSTRQIVLGVIISIAAQDLGLQIWNFLPLEIQRLDPLFDFLYSSVGLVVSACVGVYAGLNKRWPLLGGTIIGAVLWWVFLGILMTIYGSWL